MKTKIKITFSVILIFIILVLGTLIALALNNIDYNMALNKPSRIIVYYNGESGNQVFEPSDKEYDKICSLVLDACNQSILKAFVKGELNKDVKVIANETSSIIFDEIVINFVYDNPQAVKYKNKVFSYNNSTYWYQNLVFNISNNNQFGYNSVAIIPPSDASYYVNPYTYNLHYEVYSNFCNTYQYVSGLFN